MEQTNEIDRLLAWNIQSQRHLRHQEKLVVEWWKKLNFDTNPTLAV